MIDLKGLFRTGGIGGVLGIGSLKGIGDVLGIGCLRDLRRLRAAATGDQKSGLRSKGFQQTEETLFPSTLCRRRARQENGAEP